MMHLNVSEYFARELIINRTTVYIQRYDGVSKIMEMCVYRKV